MIRIVSDTTSSLPVDLAHQLGIAFMPQIIIFGEDSYRDDSEIDTATFLQKLKASQTLPKTAAPSPALYAPVFKEWVEAGDTVFAITPSSDVSGTTRSAEVAAQDFPGADIRVIDTRTVAGGLGAIVKQAVLWVKQINDPDIVEKMVRELAAREHVYFVVDTLEYLYKGGRIGGAKALFGSILQVKPILTLRDGHIEPVESQRTKKRAVSRIKEIILQDCPHSPDCMLSIMHCDAEDEALELRAEFAAALDLPQDCIPIYLVPPAIVVHAGPKVLAVSYFTAK
jgi:DegV family protein with EDD domain